MPVTLIQEVIELRGLVIFDYFILSPEAFELTNSTFQTVT
jgi:hypothetical protein